MFHKRKAAARGGFSLIEIMVVLVITGIMVAGMVNFFGKQQRLLIGQKLVADVQSMGTIGFFLIGRDIRRAGSNPEGLWGATSPVPFALCECTISHIRILADLNGDQDTADAGEDITYDYDSTTSVITRKETLGASSDCGLTTPGTGSAVTTIANVSSFTLTYYLNDSTTTTTPTSPFSNILQIDISLGVTSNRLNPATGAAITRTFLIRNRLENFN